MEYINNNAKPFKHKGSKTGCLLIHGFTGCPAQMILLGNYLKNLGYTVKGVQLKGHGTTIEDMENSNWKDWICSAEEGLTELMEECDNIFIIGLSMGGNIALTLSSKYEIAGAISLAAPIKVSNKKAVYSSFLKYFKKYEHKDLSKISLDKMEYYISYDKTPVASIPQLFKLIRKSKRSLRKISNPILIIQSKNDNTVKYESAEIIFYKVKSKFKKLVYLKDSGHVITVDKEKERVFKEIEDFIDQINGK